MSKTVKTFLSRLLSTVVLWAIVVVAFVLGSHALFFALIAAIALLGLFEYFHLLKQATGSRRFMLPTLLVSMCYLAYLFQYRDGASPATLGAADGLAIAALIIILIITRLGSALEGRKSLNEILLALFGFTYVILLFSFAAKILCLPLVNEAGESTSAWYVLFFVVVTKLTDTGAYCVGSLIGRHKCIPHISPGKTWEGLGGGLLFAFIGAFACRYWFPDHLAALGSTSLLLLVTLSLSIVSIIGDLAESILKRTLEIKDSGQVMPGIGGVLDLIDSLLFTAPVLYLYLILIG
ncbi:MAG: phosphatidate cytidylyltransferase [Verrucomicrobiales bacterium]|nr:phosphatidate cytidylyltransferase [Verrucomicrobiales bacterium]